MSGSELQLRKVELTCAHPKNVMTSYCEYLHITMELVNTLTEATLPH